MSLMLRITEYQGDLLYSWALSNTLHSMPFILAADKLLKTLTFSWLQTETIYHRCGLCEIHQEVTWLQSKGTSSICGTLKAKKKPSTEKKNHSYNSDLLGWLLFCFVLIPYMDFKFHNMFFKYGYSGKTDYKIMHL